MDLQRSELKKVHASIGSERIEPSQNTFAEKYELLREIGHGSQGKVFLAKRRSDGKQVSVKKLDISSVKTWKEYTLFKREGEVLKSLDIDGVAKCYDTLEYPDDKPPCAYIVQEYIPGKSLQAMLKDNHHFEMGVFYDIVVQLLTILEQLHHHDPCVIHRDIKPSNILLEPKPGGYKAWLIDFGAVANPQLQSGGSTVAGTYGYMPPEQLMGNPEPASDIYALGAVIVHVLSGVSPGDMQNRDFHLMFEPELQSLHPSVVKILRQMLEPNVKQRLCDIDVLKRAFSNFRLKQFDLDADSLPVSKQWSAEQYNKTLSEVAAYGASGNIELWSQLPDNAPRSVPECYVGQMLNLEQIELLEIENVYKKQSARATKQSFFKIIPYNLLKILKFLGIFIASFFLGWIISVPFVGGFVGYHILGSFSEDRSSLLLYLCVWTVISLTVFALFNGFEYGSLIAMILLATLSGAAIAYMLCQLVEFGFRVIEHDTSFADKIIASRDWVSKKYMGLYDVQLAIKDELLKNGRKTIARVVDIQYVSCENELVVPLGEQQNNPVYYGSPVFKVFYAFNPPDDARVNDLKHFFYTHRDPSDSLNVGDPLPIVYDMNRRIIAGVNTESVFSMPFPVVLDDPISVSDVICQSSVPLGKSL